MAKRGRKTKISVTEEFLKDIRTMSGNGLTQQQIYNYLEISHNTWNNLKNKYPEIKIALKKGTANTILAVSGALLRKIKEGNLDAIKFYLKTKAGWHEKTILDSKIAVKSSAPVSKIETVDAIEASRIYQEIMAGSQKK